MYGVLLIIVLVITGGAIAFIGDRLGTKIGKKRLSIFGLRPRHTSILVTIVTGLCITAATFGIMAAASENVRTALFGLEELNDQIRKAQRNLDAATEELADARSQKEVADNELATSKEDIRKLKAEQEELRAESDRLRSEADRLRAEGESLRAENAALSAGNAELAAANESLTGDNTRLQGENKDLGKKNESLTSENKSLEQRADALGKGLVTMREGAIAFRAGEVLASGVIRGNRPVDEVRRDFEALAELATRNVSQRLGTNVSDENIWLYQPEYNAAIQEIAKSQKDMVVRIVAAGNLVWGEPVRTMLALYPNSIIYKDQEFILAQPVHFKNDDEAEGVVMKFLHDINTAAVARGMLPDPIRGTVGIMDGAQFYNIVGDLKRTRGSAILSAYANGATDAQGPLRLTIRAEASDGE